MYKTNVRLHNPIIQTRKRIFSLMFFLILIFTNLHTSGQNNKLYTNPISDTIFIADPYVLQDGNEYFLYGTSAGDGFKAWESLNLIDWEPIGYVYQRKEDSWGQGSYWAPEAIKYKEKYYLIFSCKGPEQAGLKICMAVSDSPEGPFEDLHMPLFDIGHSCIDGHIFIDDDGTPYLYYEMVGAVGDRSKNKGFLWGMIFGVQLSEDLSHFVGGEPKLCIYPSQDWENPESMNARSTEGMTVFKHNGIYYMTYSGNHYADPQYGVGYATADNPLGMWFKNDENPILSRDLEINVSGPGHNSIVKSPDGKELFIIYHSHASIEHPSGRRILNIDRLEFGPNGELKIIGPTRTPQPMPSGS